MVTAVKSKGIEQTRYVKRGDTVDVYRYLNRSRASYSIRARTGELKGKVAGYAQAVIVRNPTFFISQAGRARVLATQQKNVHCQVRGTLIDVFDAELFEERFKFVRVSYNPYLCGGFFKLTRTPDGEIEHASITPIEDALGYEFAVITLKDVLLCDAPMR